MKRIHIVLLLGLISLVVLAQPCMADIPQTITLQGTLESPSGGPLAGQYPYRVLFFDAEQGGNQLQDVIGTVTLSERGRFSISLAPNTQALEAGALWYELAVDLAGDGFDAGDVFQARVRVHSVPFARLAADSEQVGGIPASDLVLDGSLSGFLTEVPNPLTLSGSQPSSYILKGTNSSTNVLSSGVFGESTASSGVTAGVLGQSASSLGRAVTGFATSVAGKTIGVYGESDSPDGIGVAGHHDAGTGTGPGLLGLTDSNSEGAIGVKGEASANSSMTIGVWGESDSPAGTGVAGLSTPLSGTNHGVYGESNSPDGFGVYGLHDSADGVAAGVYGLTDSDDGDSVGVKGEAGAASGRTHGVWGVSASSSGRGVFGSATSALGTTYGVRGDSASSSGRGVYGLASADQGTTYGVRGESSSTSGRGVYGNASAVSGVTYGVYGASSSAEGGIGVYGIGSSNSGSNIGVHGVSDSPEGGWGVYGYGTGDEEADAGGLLCVGNFRQGAGVFRAFPTTTEWAANKPATVKLDDGTKVKLFAEEATEVCFSDYGSGQLAGGRVTIHLDPVFLQTVTINEHHPLKVFIQVEGDCQGVFVTNKTATSFDVVELRGGLSDAPFSYRVVCKRRFYEDERLATEAEDVRFNTGMLQKSWPEELGRSEKQRKRMSENGGVE